ncbi:MAG: Ig-like domain-containing protein, partial [Acidobacteria bacterium]|nr:Ig-like domain-containing protein [Acidobacteriota bacterium]
AFVTKLNLAGSGLSDLVYSTYLGGGSTESGNGIAVDAVGHAYVTGQTLTSGSTPFPTTAGALDLARDGSSDAFVTKLNLAGSGLSDLVYSTYLGGGGTERGNGVALDAALNVYVTGQTLSSGSTPFPTTAGAFQTGLNGTSNDAFVTKLNLAGSGLSDLVYSTYLGGGSTESGNGIAVDAAGHAFVTGQTLSSGSTPFPTTADALDLTRDGASDAFVTKLNLAGSGLSDLVYSTYLGGGGTESGNGIAVDAAGNLYVTGQTSSSSTAPAIPFPTTARAFDPSFNGGTQDAFVAKFGEALVPVLLTLDPPDATNPVSSQHCVTATVQGAGDTLVPGITVWFEVNANGAVAASGSEVTDANGQVDFCYTGPEHPRLDAVSAFADTDENGLQGSTEPGGTAAKTWVPDAPATLVLVPADATNPVATEHCVTATVIDSFGNPTPGITVRFSVTGTVSTTGSATTNAEGAVAFCYTSTTAGVDTISAFADTDGDGTQDDGTQDGGEPGGEATKIWVPGPPFSLTLAPATATNPVDAQHCVTASVKDLYRNATPGIAVRFSVAGAVNTSGSATTNPSGDAVFCYTALLPGADTITAYADTDTDHVKDEGEPTGTAAKTWVLPASTVGCKVTGGGNITTVNGARATFGGNAQSNKGLTRGNQEYQDHGPAQRRNVKSLNVLAVVCGSPAQATIFGQASVNGSGTLFYRIDVKDMGEPGRGRDSYSILLSDGYTSREQILDGGNIQIH